MHAEGRPVRVGTRSVKASEHLASLLDGTGLHVIATECRGWRIRCPSGCVT
jgi:preprotein translocase subunit SecA